MLDAISQNKHFSLSVHDQDNLIQGTTKPLDGTLQKQRHMFWLV